MKNLAFALVVAVLLAGLWTKASAEPRTQRAIWEYKVIASVHPQHIEQNRAFMQAQGMEVLRAQDFLAGLKSSGSKGWDLCMSMKWGDIGWLYYFKRPR